MNCPNCGAPMRLDEGADHWSCEFCLSLYAPAPDQDGLCVLDAAMENCPLCQGGLNHAVLVGVRLLSCPHCRGMLIPMADFMTTAERLRATLPGSSVPLAPPPARELQRRIDCPRCRQPMDNHLYGGAGSIIIDSCENCAVIWLDAGELRRVASAPDYQYRPSLES